jgi:hypothetical protein
MLLQKLSTQSAAQVEAHGLGKCNGHRRKASIALQTIRRLAAFTTMNLIKELAILYKYHPMTITS